MDFTYELSKSFNVIPFEIMKQDKDEVIMLINYFIEKSEHEESTTERKQGSKKPYKHDNFWDM